MEAVKPSAPPVRDERPPLQKGTPHHCHPGSRYFHRRHSLPQTPGLCQPGHRYRPAGLGSDKEEAAKGVVTVITHAARIGMPLAELVDLEKEKGPNRQGAEKEPRRAGKAQQQTQQPRLPGQSAGAGCRRGKGAAEKLTALIAQLEAQEASL